MFIERAALEAWNTTTVYGAASFSHVVPPILSIKRSLLIALGSPETNISPGWIPKVHGKTAERPRLGRR
jgi:hypothetical protein